MKKIIKILVAIILTIITLIFFTLDFIDFFKNYSFNLAQGEIKNMNLDFWVSYIEFIILCFLLNYLFTKVLNTLHYMEYEKKVDQEEQKQLKDQEMKYILYSTNKIKEPTLWIKNTKKYDDRLKEYLKSEISEIKDFSIKEKLFQNFLKDLKIMYSLYEDIELLADCMLSSEEKEYYIKLEKTKKNQLENLRSPKYIITKSITINGKKVKIINTLNLLTNQQQYEVLVKEVRQIYYKELIKLINYVNMN